MRASDLIGGLIKSGTIAALCGDAAKWGPVVQGLQALLRYLDSQLLAVGHRIAAANQGKLQGIKDAIAKGAKSEELSGTLYETTSQVCRREPHFAEYMETIAEATAHTIAQGLDATQSMGLLEMLGLVPETEVSARRHNAPFCCSCAVWGMTPKG